MEVAGEVNINESFLKLLSTYFFRRLVLCASCPEPGLSPQGKRLEKEQMGHLRPPSVLRPCSEMKTSDFSLHRPFGG